MSESARKIAMLGEKLRQEGNYSGAIECFTRAIHAQPNYWWAYAHRGAARGALGDYEGACDDFQNKDVVNHYMKCNPGWFLAQKGELYRLWAMAATSRRDESEAQKSEYLRGEISTSTSLWDSLSARAIDLFTEALGDSEPRNPWILAHRGATYTMRYWIGTDMFRVLSEPERAPLAKGMPHKDEEYELADRDLREAIKLNPTYGWVYLFLAILRGTRGYCHRPAPERIVEGMLHDLNESMLNIGKAQMSGLNRELSMLRAMMELAIYTGGELALASPDDSQTRSAATRVFRDGVQLAWRTLQIESDETPARYFVANGLKQLANLSGVDDPMVGAAIKRARAALDGMTARSLAMSGGLDCLVGDFPSARKKLAEIRRLRDLQAITMVSRDPAWAPLRGETGANLELD